MSSSSSKGTHSLRFYNSRKHSKPITARYSRQQLSGRCCTGELEALGSEKASGRRKAFSLRRAPISCVLLVLGRLGLRWYFVVFRARVYPRSGRSSGDPSGRGHVVVPRGRTRSVLPARASLAHSDPLVVSSIAFCRALHRVRRSWGRYSPALISSCIIATKKCTTLLMCKLPGTAGATIQVPIICDL